jgi:hypothetical protein
MDPGYRSPLIDLFRRGEVTRDIRLLAAGGALAPRALEQLALLVLLTGDPDRMVALQANVTIENLPRAPLAAFLARPDVPTELRAFFAARGITPATVPAEDTSEPLIDTLRELPRVPDTEADSDGGKAEDTRIVSSLPIMDRIKLAMKGTREQRAQLIRDSNKLVASAVLSSPKLSESEVEAFAKMANVSEEVLRVIANNRGWLKNYGVVLGLARNPKTPPPISMQLLHRLNERDMKMLSTDRNVPEAVRLAARKFVVKKLS